MSALDIDRLRAALPVHHLGTPIIYAPVIASTNTLALQRLETDGTPGTLILTDTQPAGRGRQGRTWVTLPERQILLSLILELPFAPHWLVMAAALALRDAAVAAEVPSDRIAIKWPNDLLVDGRKIAGILIETTTFSDNRRAVILGMGVNVQGSLAAWPAIAATATTLEDALGRTFDREELILGFLDHLGQSITAITARGDAATRILWQTWRAQLATLGQPTIVHQVDTTLSGIAEDVAPDGALLLRLPDGTLRTITWGDIALG